MVDMSYSYSQKSIGYFCADFIADYLHLAPSEYNPLFIYKGRGLI